MQTMVVLESLETMSRFERLGTMFVAWAIIWAFVLFMIWNGHD